MTHAKFWLPKIGVLVIACAMVIAAYRYRGQTASSPNTTPETSADPVLAVLKDISYTLDGGPVPLKGGYLMRPVASPASGIEKFALQTNVATVGELTGDSTPEVVTLVFKQGADQEVTSYLVILSNPNQPTQLAATKFNGQVQVNAVMIQDQVIEVRYFEVDTSPATKTSTSSGPVAKLKYFRLNGDQIVEAAAPADGRPFNNSPLPLLP